MKHYRIELRGKTPLLMHYDNIEWADLLESWRRNPHNKGQSKPGDDRSPAWTWIGSLYHDGTHLAIPSDNLMSCEMQAGAMVPTGKRQGTFKSQTQSGTNIAEPFWTLMVKGRPIDFAPIRALYENEVTDFAAHQEAAREAGFALFLKRAKIGTSKHIRVRPRFDTWSASGTLRVVDPTLTTEVLRTIWQFAGNYKGIGDWRPGGKTPGSFGMFDATVTEVSA